MVIRQVIKISLPEKFIAKESDLSLMEIIW